MSNDIDFDNIVKSQTETATIEEIERKLNVRFKSGKMSKLVKNKLSSTVKPDDLHLDLSYQRSVNENKVRLIMNNFNEHAIGVVTLSMRENGDLYIIDGSHRIEALKRLGLGGSDLNAIVFFDLSLEEESELFILMNENRTKPKRADIHKASALSNIGAASEINEMLASIGLHIGSKPGENTVRAITHLYKVYDKVGIETLKKVMTVLIDANGNHSSSFQAEYMTAVGMIFAKFKNVDSTRLAVAIASAGSPTLALANAGMKASNKTPLAKVVSLAVMFVDLYNHKLRVNRLDRIKILSVDHRNYLNVEK
jgi:hypothetical protein